jgi:hypothetical protein
VYRGYVTEPRHDKRKNIRRSKELGGLQPAIIGVNLRSSKRRAGRFGNKLKSEYKYAMSAPLARNSKTRVPPRFETLRMQEMADGLDPFNWCSRWAPVSLSSFTCRPRSCRKAGLIAWIESGGRAFPGG